MQLPSNKMLPSMPSTFTRTTTGSRQPVQSTIVPPEEWEMVVQRMAPFFPTLPKETIGSAVCSP
jgi:hypothetical protein